MAAVSMDEAKTLIGIEFHDNAQILGMVTVLGVNNGFAAGR